MRRLIVIALFYSLILLIHAENNTRIAIINASSNDESASKFCDLISAELMENDKLEILEREQIQKVLREQEINLSNSNSALKAGQILRAELLVALQKIPESQNAIKLIGFDIRHGLRILDMKLPSQEDAFTKRGIEAINKAIALSKKRNPTVYSVPPLINDDFLFKYDKYQDIIAIALREELVKKGAFVIEFEEAKRIFKEFQTSQGKEKIDLPNVLILNGCFSPDKRQKDNLIVILYKISVLSQKAEIINGKTNISNKVLFENNVSSIAENIIKDQPEANSNKSNIDELLNSLLSRAEKHIKKTSYHQAKQELEVALLLSQSSLEARQMLTLCYKNIIYKCDKEKLSEDAICALYNEYFKNIEWFVYNQHPYPQKLIDSMLDNSIDRLLTGQNRKRILEEANALCRKIIIDYPYSKLKKWPQVIYLESLDALIKEPQKRNIIVNNLIIEKGDSFFLENQNSEIFNDYMDGMKWGSKGSNAPCSYLFAMQLQDLLQRKELSPITRRAAISQLKKMNKRLSKLPKRQSKYNQYFEIPEISQELQKKELDEIEKAPSEKLLSKPHEELLSKAREFYRRGRLNKTRLCYEAALKKVKKLPANDELKLTSVYAIMISNFPYSEPATPREKDIALNLNLKAFDSLERLCKFSDLKLDFIYFNKLSMLCSVTKNLKLENPTEEDIKRVLPLIKKIRKLFEDIAFEKAAPSKRYAYILIEFMRQPYSASYFWLEKDDNERFKNLKSFHIRGGDKLTKRPIFIMNIYKHGKNKDIEKAIKLYQYLLADKELSPKLRRFAGKGLASLRKNKTKQTCGNENKKNPYPLWVKLTQLNLHNISHDNKSKSSRIRKILKCGKKYDAFCYINQVVFFYSKNKYYKIIKNPELVDLICDAVWDNDRLWVAVIYKNKAEASGLSKGEIICWNPQTCKTQKWGFKEGILTEYLTESDKWKNGEKWRKKYRNNHTYTTLKLYPYQDKVFIFCSYINPKSDTIYACSNFFAKSWIGALNKKTGKIDIFIKCKDKNDKNYELLKKASFWDKIILLQNKKSKSMIVYYGNRSSLLLDPDSKKITTGKGLLNPNFAFDFHIRVDQSLLKSPIIYNAQYRPELYILNSKRDKIEFTIDDKMLGGGGSQYNVKQKVIEHMDNYFIDSYKLGFIDLQKKNITFILDEKEKYTPVLQDIFSSNIFGLLAHNFNSGRFFKMDIDLKEALKEK